MQYSSKEHRLIWMVLTTRPGGDVALPQKSWVFFKKVVLVALLDYSIIIDDK